MNTLKTKVDNLIIDKLKKLNDLVKKKVLNKSVQNKLNTKVNNLENKIPDAPNLIHTNQYNADKQSSKQKY